MAWMVTMPRLAKVSALTRAGVWKRSGVNVCSGTMGTFTRLFI